jgi:hypothetical protein
VQEVTIESPTNVLLWRSIHLEEAERHRTPVRLRVLAGAAVVAADPSVTGRNGHTECRAAERKEALYEELIRLTG